MGLRTKTKIFVLKMLTRKDSIETRRWWEGLYGKFDETDYDSFLISGLPSESGVYHGELVKWAKDVSPNNVLFVGENKPTAHILKSIIQAPEVHTAGLGDAEFEWNFENDAPEELMQGFDLIVSQAILEHLLNPYKHLSDLRSLVGENGYIVLHTVMPGFSYHRHPIDSVRFYPDWFEEAGKRIGLRAVKKRINDNHIYYMYQKC